MDFHGFLMIFASAAGLGRCRRHKIDPKNRPKKYFSTNFFFDQNGFEFFSMKKTFDEKNLDTYSDGEFPQDSKNHT